MFKLTLRPELSFPNAIIMTILFLGFCTFCGWLWQRYGPKKYAHLFLNLLLTLLGIIFIVGMIFGSALTHDEIEHAHAGWLVYKGLIPFTDFFQHHNPVLWIILAPLFKSSFISNNIFFIRTNFSHMLQSGFCSYSGTDDKICLAGEKSCFAHVPVCYEHYLLS